MSVTSLHRAAQTERRAWHDLRREGEAILLDREGRFRIVLDAGGIPAQVTLDGRAGTLMAFDPDAAPGALHNLSPNDAAVITPKVPSEPMKRRVRS